MNSLNHHSNLAYLLSALIKLNNKRIKSFTRAYDLMRDNIDLKSIFKERIHQSRVFIEDLKNIISHYTKDKTLADSYLNVDMLNVSVCGQNVTILEECVLGEKEAVDGYEERLRSMADAPAPIRQKIRGQLNNVKKSYEFIKNFRDFNLDLTA